jgi:hypothetical protein
VRFYTSGVKSFVSGKQKMQKERTKWPEETKRTE